MLYHLHVIKFVCHLSKNNVLCLQSESSERLFSSSSEDWDPRQTNQSALPTTPEERPDDGESRGFKVHFESLLISIDCSSCGSVGISSREYVSPMSYQWKISLRERSVLYFLKGLKIYVGWLVILMTTVSVYSRSYEASVDRIALFIDLMDVFLALYLVSLPLS